MDGVLDKVMALYTYASQSGWLFFIIYIVAGLVGVSAMRRVFRTLEKHDKLPAQVRRFAEKIIYFLIWCLVVVQGLHSIGVDVVSFLGAAGVAGVAIGFASQTVLSNLISGIFIMCERNVKLGDYIRIADKEGTVEKINLLSITLKQHDNARVRIPCETLIKNPVVNVTGEALRRCDIDVSVDYSSDLEQVRNVILATIAEVPELLDSPSPVILFNRFADSALELHIGAWCKTADYYEARFHLANALLKAFREKGINIPFPIVTVQGK